MTVIRKDAAIHAVLVLLPLKCCDMLHHYRLLFYNYFMKIYVLFEVYLEQTC